MGWGESEGSLELDPGKTRTRESRWVALSRCPFTTEVLDVPVTESLGG